MKKKAVKPVAMATILLLLVILIYGGNNWLQPTYFQVKGGGLPQSFDGFKIVHIGDLHGKEFGTKNTRLARIIKKEKPDVILASGDMINSRGDDGSAFIHLLKELNAVCPVYCSLGNHEQSVLNWDLSEGTTVFDTFTENIRGTGCTVLDNQAVELSRDEESIIIYGFTAALYHYTGSDTAHWEGADLKADFIEQELGLPQPGRFNILLAHNPKYLDEYRSWGANLVLSGHVHGGVIRLPFLGGVFSPDITFFPKYSAGLYRSGETQMHVTRGLGNSGIPFRFLNRPEVAIITLNNE